MKHAREFVWPVIGLLAVVVSAWLLYHELRDLSLRGGVVEPHGDSRRIDISWPRCRPWSPTRRSPGTTASRSCISASATSPGGSSRCARSPPTRCRTTSAPRSSPGALVRYRAYTSKGLSAPQVAVLVALCSFTFAPRHDPARRARADHRARALRAPAGRRSRTVLTNPTTARVIGLVLLGFVVLYVLGSLLHLRPLVIRKLQARVSAPGRDGAPARRRAARTAGGRRHHLFRAAGDGQPRAYIAVLAVFLASFSAALVSHAPGGLGVFELVFVPSCPTCRRRRCSPR